MDVSGRVLPLKQVCMKHAMAIPSRPSNTVSASLTSPLILQYALSSKESYHGMPSKTGDPSSVMTTSCSNIFEYL